MQGVKTIARTVTVLSFVAALSVTAGARAAPRHDICADLGPSFAFGVSSFGSVRDWAPAAKSQYGADFKLLYVYILAGGMDDPDNFAEWYIRPFVETAQQMDAMPLLTFYQLLDLGRAAGHGGSEPEVVAAALADAGVMRTYFDHWVWLLELAAEFTPPVIIHSEPDSWGFMMWAMGVEGNDDPTSVPVQVQSSGHPETAGFSDDAAGLGQALVALRDSHAPEVRLGWHASNFRAGSQPEVVSNFYAQVGDWDVLIGEHPHLEPNEATWWEPLDTDRIDVNVSWLSSVTSSAGVPLIFWQMPIGTVDWHWIGDPSDLSLLERFVDAGAVALLFDHQSNHGATDPDDFRAAGDLGTPPPASHPAGGTAADMRARVAAYSQAPLSWPAGSLCDQGISTGGSGTGGGGTAGTGAAGSGQGGGVAPAAPADTTDDGGCGCVLPGPRPHRGLSLLASAIALAALWWRRRR